MKAACGPAHMKSILAIGELGSMNNVYKVSDGGCSYMISALFPALVSLINKKVSVRRPYWKLDWAIFNIYSFYYWNDGIVTISFNPLLPFLMTSWTSCMDSPRILNDNVVYQCSLVCMMAGSDFIKTSTGKESVNATLGVGLVMCRAIREYHQHTGFRVGFKPAGGIRWTVIFSVEALLENEQQPFFFIKLEFRILKISIWKWSLDLEDWNIV